MSVAMVLDELAQARWELVDAAARDQAPPRAGVLALDRWAEECARLPAGTVAAEHMARAWGNLQLVLVDGEPDSVADTAQAMAWQRVRRMAEAGMQALAKRPEWASLYGDLQEEVLPLLADAVARPRRQRLARCVEAMAHLRALAARTSGAPHGWRIDRITEMAYPIITADGWGSDADGDVTWRRMQAVAQALLEALHAQGLSERPLVIGFAMPRPAGLSARLMTEMAVAYGQPVHLCGTAQPLPALVHHAVQTLGVGANAGVVLCTASSGDAAFGLRYLTPYGTPPPATFTRRLARRAAELLLAPSLLLPGEPPGAVTMIDPWPAYQQRVIHAVDFPVLDTHGEEQTAAEAMQAFWGRPSGRILIVAASDAAGEAAQRLCDAFHLPGELLLQRRHAWHDAQDDMLDTLVARVKEEAGEREPIIGLAFDAVAERVTVVDEDGVPLPGDALMALLASYLLEEGYPGTPGMLMRGRNAARLLDRLADTSRVAGRLLPREAALPNYLQAPDYRIIAGDPALLQGTSVQVARDLAEMGEIAFAGLSAALIRHARGELSAAGVQELFTTALHRVLLAGDGNGALSARGVLPIADGLWTALCLLQLCAVRRAPIGALWQRLQMHHGALAVDHLRLRAPDAVKRVVINRLLRQEETRGHDEPLAGCRVRYAGGSDDRLAEWALEDIEGAPAYLAVEAVETEPWLQVTAHARTSEVTRRLLFVVAERLEHLLLEALRQAQDAWKVVAILADTQPPRAITAGVPGTLNCRVARQAYARLQELAHPGCEAPDLLRFVTDRLHATHPENARVLTACHLADPNPEITPPPPHVNWEGEG